MGFECSFPLIAFSDSDKMVHMVEVNFWVDLSLLRCIQQIQDEWEQVMVFFGNFIQCMEIDTKPKQAIFLFDKENGCPMWGLWKLNEAHV